MISHNQRVSIGQLVENNERRYAHIAAPIIVENKLPPLASPRTMKSNNNVSKHESSGLALKKVIVGSGASNRRTKSLARQRPQAFVS